MDLFFSDLVFDCVEFIMHFLDETCEPKFSV